MPMVLNVLHLKLELEGVQEKDKLLGPSATRVADTTGALQARLFRRSREGS